MQRLLYSAKISWIIEKKNPFIVLGKRSHSGSKKGINQGKQSFPNCGVKCGSVDKPLRDGSLLLSLV